MPGLVPGIHNHSLGVMDCRDKPGNDTPKAIAREDDMSGAEIIDIARDGIWTMLQVSGPLMLVGLAVGVAIALVQALTQIQEMTLVFVPKIIVAMLSLILLLPFMLSTLSGFTERLADRIINIG